MGRAPTAPQSPFFGLRANRVFTLGLVSGFALILVGLAMFFFERYHPVPRLTMCVGFGILLASFGTMAEVRYKEITIVGAGAVTVILYWLIDVTPSYYTHGSISGTTRPLAIKLVDRNELLGGFRDNTYYFIIEGNELRSSTVKAFVVTADNREIILSIPRDKVAAYFGKNEDIDWMLDLENERLIEASSGSVVASNDITDLPGSLGDSASAADWLNGLLSAAAYAFEPLTYSITDAIQELQSDNPYSRYESRDALVAYGVGAVGPLVEEYAQRRGDPRVELGVLYALSEIAAANPDALDAMRAAIPDDRFALLADAITSEDRTVRRQATALFARLDDDRIVDQAFRIARTAANTEGAYNAIYLIGDSYGRLPAERQATVASELGAFKGQAGPQTGELIDAIIAGQFDAMFAGKS